MLERALQVICALLVYEPFLMVTIRKTDFRKMTP